jgi:hypothetical protein
MAEVTFSTAGYEYFGAETLHFFKQCDVCSSLRRCPRSKHPCCTTTNHDYFSLRYIIHSGTLFSFSHAVIAKAWSQPLGASDQQPPPTQPQLATLQ